MTVLDEVQRAIRKIKEQRRTILCSPDRAQPIRDLVSAEGLGGFFEVLESEHVPSDFVFVSRASHFAQSGDAAWQNYLSQRGVKVS